MAPDIHSTIIDCLRLLLRPVVKFCLRRSLGLQDVIESAKVVFLEVAEEEMRGRGGPINLSRLSAVTGVHRKDVSRIYREGDIHDESTRFTSRVIGQWRRDGRFLTSSDRPRVLTFGTDDSDFARLVRLVSSDLHPGAVLYDLERVGAVERTKNGLKLSAKAYVPRGNPKEGFQMLAEDASDLVEAVIENIFTEEKDLPNYHAAAHYDNVSEEDLPKIRAWFFEQCSVLHQKAARFLSRYDLDINPNKKKKGGKRVMLGIFTRT